MTWTTTTVGGDTVHTQTGTDTDISGLTGRTNVTTTTVNGITYISCGTTTRLVINGTLTHKDPSQVLVINYESASSNAFDLDDGTDDRVGIAVNGTFNYGEEVTINSVPYRSEHLLMYFRSTQAENFFLMHGMRVNGGGTFNWDSNWILSESTIGKSTDNTASFNVAGPECRLLAGDSNQVPSVPRQIRFAGDTGSNISGITYDGFESGLSSRVFGNQGLSNVSGIKLLSAEIQQRNGEPCGLLSLSNLALANNRYFNDVALIGSNSRWATTPFDVQPIQLKNLDVGTQVRFTKDAANNKAAVLVLQDYTANVQDSGGNIQDCLVYIPTTNDGNRRTIQGAGNSLVYNNWNPTSSIYDSYSATTDVNGDITTQEVVLMFVVTDTNNETSTTDIDYIMYDETGVKGNDEYTSYFYSYGHLLDSTALVLRSSSVFQENKVLIEDSSITQSNRTTVQGYVSIDNADELYDRYKDWKVTLANISFPSLTTQHINPAGTILAIGASSLVIDSAAASAFAVNTSGSGTVTIDTTTFTNGTTFSAGLSTSTGSVTVATNTNISANITGNLILQGNAVMSGIATLDSSRVLTAPSQTNVTGNVNINNGGRLDLADLTTDQLTGTLSSGGRIRINGASTSQTLDLRAGTIAPGFVVENDSGINITLRLNATQTIPTLTETSGTITVDNSAPLTVTNLTNAYIYLENNLGVQQDYQTLVNGTYNFGIPATATGTWKLVIDRQGFDRKSFSFTADGNAREFDGTLTQQVDLAGGAIYQAQSSSDVNVVGASSRIDVQNSTISGSVIYDMVQDYAISAAGMADDTVDALSYFPTDNGNYFSLATWQFRRNAAAVSLPTVNAIVSQNSDDPVDETNGQVSVQFSGESGGLNEAELHAALDSYLNKDGWKADLTPVITAITNLNDVSVAQIRAGFDETEFRNTQTEIHNYLDSYVNKDNWKSDVSSLVDIAANIILLLKYHQGNILLDENTNTLTVYDPADGVTPILTFNTKDKDGNAATESIFELEGQ